MIVRPASSTARTAARSLAFSLAVLACISLPRPGFGQASAAAAGAPATSRLDLFGGYAYFAPFSSDIANVQYEKIKYGAVGSVTGYFGKHLGLQAEGQYSPNGNTDNSCAYTAQAGPVYRLPMGRFVPFAHALGGGAIVGGPRAQKCNVWGWGVTGGFGLDIILPVLHDHLALRAVQADFLYSDIDNGPISAGGFYGGETQITAYRLAAGVVYRFGNINPLAAEPAFNCSADPGNPFPGDPVTLTASSMNVNPKRRPMYLWTASAGKVTGNGPTAVVDTSGMQAGTYSVSGRLVEGTRQRLIASCTSSFTVRAYQPPTVSCAADKSAIHSGDPVNITSTAVSPQNRAITYSYTSTAGIIQPSGPTAVLSTVGTAPGNVTVTCNISDDRAHTASATASFVVATPAPPPAALQARVQNLCSITFDRDRKRPDRVDNEAKGCLDDVALTMNRETTSKLVLIGSHADKETNRNAAERTLNAAQYLTQEKGVDPARLDLRIGPDNSRSVAMVLMPPGTAVDPATASSFDTTAVKRTGQAYGKPRAATTPKPKIRRRRKIKPTPPPAPQ